MYSVYEFLALSALSNLHKLQLQKDFTEGLNYMEISLVSFLHVLDFPPTKTFHVKDPITFLFD